MRSLKLTPAPALPGTVLTSVLRFSCFLCNFDLCESCVHRKLGQCRGRARDSWLYDPAPAPASAPLLELVQEEEPPPSYHQAMASADCSFKNIV